MSTVHCVLWAGKEGREAVSTDCITTGNNVIFNSSGSAAYVLSVLGKCPASQCIAVMAQPSHACLFMLSVHQHSSVSEMVGIRQHRRRTQSYSERRLEAKAVSLSPGKNEDIHTLVGVCFLNVNFSNVINHLE